MVDRCDGCCGLWFDFTRSEKYAPTAATFTAMGSGLTTRRCPDCKVSLETVLLVGSIPVETCSLCRGFWLDANDLRELGADVPLPEPAAAEVVDPNAFTCAKCGQSTPRSKANATARGLVCTTCTPQVAALGGPGDSALGRLVDRLLPHVRTRSNGPWRPGSFDFNWWDD